MQPIATMSCGKSWTRSVTMQRQFTGSLMEADVKQRIVVAGLVLVVASGCGRSEEQQQAEQAAEQIRQGAEQVAAGAERSAEQMAQGLQQMAQGFQQMAQGAATPVDFEQLKAALPEVDGWTRSEARGEQVSMPVAMSRAEARYRQGDASIELEIMDSALSQLLLAPMSMFLASGYSERSDSGFKRAAKIGGQPGIEEWNSDSKRGEVTAVVSNRFIVKATGHDVADLAVVRKTVESVDFSKLSSLK